MLQIRALTFELFMISGTSLVKKLGNRRSLKRFPAKVRRPQKLEMGSSASAADHVGRKKLKDDEDETDLFSI